MLKNALSNSIMRSVLSLLLVLAFSGCSNSGGGGGGPAGTPSFPLKDDTVTELPTISVNPSQPPGGGYSNGDRD